MIAARFLPILSTTGPMNGDVIAPETKPMAYSDATEYP